MSGAFRWFWVTWVGSCVGELSGSFMFLLLHSRNFLQMEK